MAAINQTKLIQFLRGTATDKASAIQSLKDVTFAEGQNYDGTIVLARYPDAADANVTKTIFALYSKVGNTKHVSIFDNFEDVNAAAGFDVEGKYVVKGEDTILSAATSLAVADTKLAEAIRALDAKNAPSSSDKTVNISVTDDGTDFKVNIDGTTIVKSTEEGDNKGKISTAIEIKYFAAVPATESKEAIPAHIALIDNAGNELSTVQVSDIIGDGVLDHSEYDKETGILHLYFKQADGSLKDEQINLKEMLDIDDVVIGTESQAYLSAKTTSTVAYENADGNRINKEQYEALDEEAKKAYHIVDEEGIELNVIKGTVAKPEITPADAAAINAKHLVADKNGKKPGEEGYITTYEEGYTAVTASDAVPATTGLATSEDVTEAIADEVLLLEEKIEELQANSLTGVSVNGLEAAYDKEGDTTHVAVVINGDDIEIASSYIEVEYDEVFAAKEGVSAIVSTDHVSEAFTKVESTIKALVAEVLDNEETTEKAIEAVANAAGIVDGDGTIVYTKHESDDILSAATSLDGADLALADAIRKAKAAATTVVDALTGNTEKLGAHITSDEDKETKATTYHVDVNFDFGTVTF